LLIKTSAAYSTLVPSGRSIFKFVAESVLLLQLKKPR
jgi:hypothetical protein